MKPVATVTNTFIVHSFTSSRRKAESLKRLSDEFLAFLPKRLSSVRVERVSAHSFADGADSHVVRHNLTDMFSQYRPPISSAEATKPAHTEVAAPCGIVFHWNDALPSAASC